LVVLLLGARREELLEPLALLGPAEEPVHALEALLELLAAVALHEVLAAADHRVDPLLERAALGGAEDLAGDLHEPRHVLAVDAVLELLHELSLVAEVLRLDLLLETAERLEDQLAVRGRERVGD